MMKRNKRVFVLSLAVFIFLIGIWGTGVAAKETEKTNDGRILFISSYSYGWDTVQSQIEGIKDGIDDNTTVDYEFMDTKRVDDDTSRQMFYEGLKYRMSKVEPYDVVILGDDAALRFAMENREELFADIPLVFEGINDEKLALTVSEDPLITGVLEKLSVEKNIDFARALMPDAQKVVAILDDTVTGQAERERFFSYQEKYPDLEFVEINSSELTGSKLKQRISQVGKNNILIYIVMTEDADGKHYSNKEAVKVITSAARTPVFRMVDGGIGEGILGGNVVSMYKSGEIAAALPWISLMAKKPKKSELLLTVPTFIVWISRSWKSMSLIWI